MRLLVETSILTCLGTAAHPKLSVVLNAFAVLRKRGDALWLDAISAQFEVVTLDGIPIH
jgi:hypothetical protein